MAALRWKFGYEYALSLTGLGKHLLGWIIMASYVAVNIGMQCLNRLPYLTIDLSPTATFPRSSVDIEPAIH